MTTGHPVAMEVESFDSHVSKLELNFHAVTFTSVALFSIVLLILISSDSFLVVSDVFENQEIQDG